MRLVALVFVWALASVSLLAQSNEPVDERAGDALRGGDAAVVAPRVNAWDAYQLEIIAVLLLQSGLIAGLLFQFTRRRGIEKDLRDTQQRYLLASAAGSVGIWDWNLETNELFIDARLKSLLGFEDAEISNRPDDWGSRIHALDLPQSTAAVQACVNGETDNYQVEHRMIHKDGGIKWMLSRGSAIRGADGKLQRLVGTKVDITDRKNAEEAIREGQAILEASNRENHDLAGRLITSQEGERARLARDLHDDLSQQLAGLSIALSALKRRVVLHDGGELAAEVTALQQRTLAIADNIRRLSHDLHPSVLEHAGLVRALRDHCAEVARLHSIEVAVSVDGDLDSTDPAAALCLYRVAQEALRNVAAHAGARRAEVQLARVDDDAQLTIVDDGRGFDIVAAGKKADALGLVSISERVRLAGGDVSIVTEMNKGTRVRVQIPAHRHVLAATSP